MLWKKVPLSSPQESPYVSCSTCKHLVFLNDAKKVKDQGGYLYFCPEHKVKWDERRWSSEYDHKKQCLTGREIMRYFRHNVECNYDGKIKDDAN